MFKLTLDTLSGWETEMERAPAPKMLVLVTPKLKLDERISFEKRTRLSEGIDEDDLDAEAIAVKTMLLVNFDCDFIAINCVDDFAFVILSAPNPFIPKGANCKSPQTSAFSSLRTCKKNGGGWPFLA